MHTYKSLSATANRRSKLLAQILLYDMPASCGLLATLVNEYLDGKLTFGFGLSIVALLGSLCSNLADLAKAMGQEKIHQAIRIAVNTLYLGLVATFLFQIWWHEGLKHRAIF
jgi:hypothetical protein